MTTKKERAERGLQIVEYLRRNELRVDSVFRPDELQALGTIGGGDYIFPPLTPTEMVTACEMIVREKPRRLAEYGVGQFLFRIEDMKGERVTKKKCGIWRFWFPEHNFGVHRKSFHKKYGSVTHHDYRWVWEGEVDSELLMMFRMSLPASVVKRLRY